MFCSQKLVTRFGTIYYLLVKQWGSKVAAVLRI